MPSTAPTNFGIGTLVFMRAARTTVQEPSLARALADRYVHVRRKLLFEDASVSQHGGAFEHLDVARGLATELVGHVEAVRAIFERKCRPLLFQLGLGALLLLH